MCVSYHHLDFDRRLLSANLVLVTFTYLTSFCGLKLLLCVDTPSLAVPPPRREHLGRFQLGHYG